MFKIQKIQSSNKTIRMPDPLIEKLQALADKNDISFNNLVVQCCEYALNDLYSPLSSKNPQGHLNYVEK